LFRQRRSVLIRATRGYPTAVGSGRGVHVVHITLAISLALMALSSAFPLLPQTPPNAAELARYTGLQQTAVAGKTARVADALARGELVDARDGHGRTPLHVAAYFLQHAIMRARVEAGANVNLADGQGATPLALARARRYTAMVRILEQAGAR